VVVRVNARYGVLYTVGVIVFLFSDYLKSVLLAKRIFLECD
jgi:hypothetical protein